MAQRTEKPKDELAVILGKRGGIARAKKMTSKQRTASASKAALARWSKKRKSAA